MRSAPRSSKLRWDRASSLLELGKSFGFSMIEVGVGLALVAIILTAAWGWQGSLTVRRLQNAAYLLEGDLRWAQQMAVSNAGNGPQVEVCFRSSGYDIYTTAYAGSDPLNIDITNYTVVAGTRIKTVNSGQEYASGIQVTLPSTATVTCTASPTLTAIAFRSSGQPTFTDASHSITLTLNGRTDLVTIQPFTGLVTVSR